MNVCNNFSFIKRLASASPAERRHVLLNASNKNLKAIAEICLNLIRGNIQVDNKTKTRFKRHQKPILLLANRKTSLKRKKQIINQKGSGAFLAPLASLALPLIATLAERTIKKVIK